MERRLPGDGRAFALHALVLQSAAERLAPGDGGARPASLARVDHARVERVMGERMYLSTTANGGLR